MAEGSLEMALETAIQNQMSEYCGENDKVRDYGQYSTTFLPNLSRVQDSTQVKNFSIFWLVRGKNCWLVIAS